RPAVSRNTASSVNHQSQLRVPPTPRSASLPKRSDSGKLSPEFCSKVLLPEPGGPITTYHGSAYRLPPRRVLRRVSTASWKRACSWLRSVALRWSPSPAWAPCPASSPDICCALPRARHARICRIASHTTTISTISSRRAATPASGCDAPMPRYGPPTQTSTASSTMPISVMNQPVFSKLRILATGSTLGDIHELHAPIARTIRRQVRRQCDRLRVAGAGGLEPAGVVQAFAEHLLHRTRARRGQREVVLELQRADRLVVGMPHHDHPPRHLVQRRGDLVQQRQLGIGDVHATGGEHAGGRKPHQLAAVALLDDGELAGLLLRRQQLFQRGMRR